MLTPEDIHNLTEFQKTVFVTQESFDKGIEKLQNSFSTLQSSVDAISKDKKDRTQEITTVNRRLKEAEDWIDKAAVKLGLEFKH